jgi:EAL domain-containing protein (putative c-di-GMP-specific phosphodiesterase class I)
MTAPSLATASARADHVELLPLFDDELRRFSAAYQPIVDLADGRVIGHEALLRATLPTGEAVSPGDLFRAAGEAGWTHVLDRIGRTTALRQAGPWLGDDLLFINFVPTSIYRPQVCLRTTEQAALEAGLRLDQLVFEVTEGEQVRDIEHLRNVFAYYRERGCRVALDDLGAGYSSLNMLVQLRPDVVKLDKDIVQALPDPASAAVVKAIVDITHAYGGTVLAECVETEEQADAARSLDVDLAQGWLFGRPELKVPPAEVVAVTGTRSVGPRGRAAAPRPRPDPSRPGGGPAGHGRAGHDRQRAADGAAQPRRPRRGARGRRRRRAGRGHADRVRQRRLRPDDRVRAAGAARPQLPGAAGSADLPRDGRRHRHRRRAGAGAPLRARQRPQGRHALVERAAPVARARPPGPPHPLPRLPERRHGAGGGRAAAGSTWPATTRSPGWPTAPRCSSTSSRRCGRRRRTTAPSRCSTSTSTASRPSTTRTATCSATACSSRPPTGSGERCVPPTCSRGTAATSSSRC